MNTRYLVRTATVIVGLLCILPGFVRADKLQLQEKLSKEAKIQLNDVTIAEALEKIGQKAGVKFVLSDEAAWKLPYGEATRLSVALNGPLADSMTEMLNAFFMRYAVGDEEITIYPRPELEHILGKATAKQLELLKEIYIKPIKKYIIGDVQKTINKALGHEIMLLPIGRQQDIDISIDILRGQDSRWISRNEQRRALEPNEIGREFELPTSITIGQLLDNESAWYVSGMDFPSQIPEIKIVSVAGFREAKLDQLVDVSYKDERADVILQKLAGRTGMEFLINKLDPSWLQENISVDMQNIKLKQALINVVATVDGQIEIRIDKNSIFVSQIGRPKEAGRTRTTEGGRPIRGGRGDSQTGTEGYVGKISIPMDGGKYFIEFMLRESDLTEQLKKLRDEKMKEVLGQPAKAEPITPQDANSQK